MKPFLSWAGGKSGLIGHLNRVFKEIKCRKLTEPFVGGGAVFLSFNEEFDSFRLNDSNAILIECYSNLRNRLDDVWDVYKRLIETYQKTARKEEMYYRVRDSYNGEKLTPVERSACFILLNKTCFNGLYRQNARGKFNVAWGKREFPVFANREDLENASKILQRATLTTGDFADMEYNADELVYFDPPYQPLTGNFTAYTKDGFDFNDQLRLKNLMLELDSRGIAVVMSNSNFFEIKQWFPKEWIRTLTAPRNISQDGSNRTGVQEVLISNRWSKGE